MRPLPFARLMVPGMAGAMLLLPCPGISGRRLDDDLETLRRNGAAAMLTLVPKGELVLLQLSVERIAAACAERHLDWRHRPIDDFGIPDTEFERSWPETARWMAEQLETGCQVAVHCRAGLGRTGMIAARFLVEQGMLPAAAVAAVRAVRPGAIETQGQMAWIASGTVPRRDDRSGA